MLDLPAEVNPVTYERIRIEQKIEIKIKFRFRFDFEEFLNKMTKQFRLLYKLFFQRMLKHNSSVLYLSGFQDRPDRGPSINT